MFVEYLVTITALFWVFTEACQQNELCSVDLDDTNVQTLISGINSFTISLLKAMNTGLVSTNTVLISPVSIYVALATMLLGIKGTTQDEIAKVLGLSQIDPQTATNTLKNIIDAIELWRNAEDDPLLPTFEQISLGQGLFVSNKYELLDTFVKQAAILGTSVQNVDFETDVEGTQSTINAWFSSETHGRKDSMGSLQATTTKLFLTDTLYFYAEWDTSFDSDQTTTGNFHTSFGTTEVSKMSTKRNLPYYRNTKISYSAVELPFRGNDFTMIIVLPDRNVPDLLPSFTVGEYKNLIQNLKNTAIHLQTPKFNYNYATSLVSQLQTLKINQLFTDADLSNMLKNVREQVSLSSFEHNVEMVIDEYGAQISDPFPIYSTGDPPQNPKEFNVDHSYLLLFRHVQTNLIVFVATS